MQELCDQADNMQDTKIHHMTLLYSSRRERLSFAFLQAPRSPCTALPSIATGFAMKQEGLERTSYPRLAYLSVVSP